MSWQSSPIPPADGATINAMIDAATIWGNHATVEHEEQLAAAKKAAQALVASGALGDPSDGRVFLVSLNGHSNPGHQPTPGWANDAITVHCGSEPADSDIARYAREAYERFVAQQVAPVAVGAEGKA